MQFTHEDLHTLSQLSRITIKKEEEEKMLHDMQAILGYVSQINALPLDISSQEPDSYNVVREDLVREDSDGIRDRVLEEVSEVQDEYVKVSLVLRQL